jgi:glyoxylase-like metal-dependent hydrolase (beta-lactamase superfamily II)
LGAKDTPFVMKLADGGSSSHVGDVGGKEVDSVAVRVAAGAVVVLGGARVGVAGQDLGVAQWHSGVQGVGDRGVPQRVRADVAWMLAGSGWTLVDAGWPGDGQRIEAALAAITGGKQPQGILLTHVHPDHEGDARKLAERWGCPVWVNRPELPIAIRDFEAMRASAMLLDR